MIKKTFGELVPGQLFYWGGAKFVKVLPSYAMGNSIELGVKDGIWGVFFNRVPVETEDVATEAEGLDIELAIHDGAVTGWKMPDYVTITVKDYDCPDDYGHHFEDEDGEKYQKLVIVNEIEKNIPWYEEEV